MDIFRQSVTTVAVFLFRSNKISFVNVSFLVEMRQVWFCTRTFMVLMIVLRVIIFWKE